MSRILFPLRGDDHPSGPPIAERLKQLPSDMGGQPHRVRRSPPHTAGILALLPVGFTWPRVSPPAPVRSYRTLSPSPAYPVGSRAVYFLLHFPADRSGLPLATTVPCGVRTFLDLRLPV